MLELLDLVQARLTTLLDEALWDAPEGGQRQMQLIKLGMLPKRSADDNEDHPFTVLQLLAGVDAAGASGLKVRLTTGLYIATAERTEAEIVAAAQADLKRVVDLYRDMGQDGNYTPFSLEKIVWRVGDEQGFHPSADYYELMAELEFSAEPIL